MSGEVTSSLPLAPIILSPPPLLILLPCFQQDALGPSGRALGVAGHQCSRPRAVSPPSSLPGLGVLPGPHLPICLQLAPTFILLLPLPFSQPGPAPLCSFPPSSPLSLPPPRSVESPPLCPGLGWGGILYRGPRFAPFSKEAGSEPDSQGS